ncbi:hypothetical protein MFLAVUS_007247 [Mucor flavus]|uniref:Uncharacterized protein n=1 Tax=Mucor flavus TaxID=439312 RepID=A0ABP9Z3R4_9FUNG
MSDCRFLMSSYETSMIDSSKSHNPRSLSSYYSPREPESTSHRIWVTCEKIQEKLGKI